MKKILIYLSAISLVLMLVASCTKPAAPQYTTVTDYDGNIYKVFKIGTQYWMLGNLRTKHYADGTPLLSGNKPPEKISDSLSIYYLWAYGDTSYVYDFGYYYNWPAVMHGAPSSTASPSGVQGPCPNGFHVPSDAEWQTLINYLGGSAIAGGPMKGYSYWEGGNDGYGYQNASEFNALPAGYLQSSGLWIDRDGYAYFWTTTQHDNASADVFSIAHDTTVVTQTNIKVASGLSCRCLQN